MSAVAPSTTVHIDLDAIEPSPFNFRTDLSPDRLRGLAASIRQRGLIHPILVRPHPDAERFGQYQIVCGERRHAALKLLRDEGDDIGDIPVRVEPLDDTAALSAMLQENELRQDWTPYERAAFFRAIYDDQHFNSIRNMARTFGIGLTTLHRYLRIFDLPKTIQTLFERGRLSVTMIEVILDTPKPLQMDLAQHLADHPCNKEQARRIAKQMRNPQATDWVDRTVQALDANGVKASPTEDSGLKIELQGDSIADLNAQLETIQAALGQAKDGSKNRKRKSD